MSDEIDVFLNKVDPFAHGLSETEQAMRAHLVQDGPGDDVSGYLMECWPTSIRDMAPRKIAGFISPAAGQAFISPAAGQARCYTDEIHSTE